jgi:ADP-heptose:LPS heptosyltransferase
LPERFAELARKIVESGRKVAVIGGNGDRELCETVASDFGLSLAGALTIPQSVELLRRAELLVTNDSAPTHFASLVNCPTAVIYGATSPIFGFGPLSANSITIGLDNLKCRPCRIHGTRKCPLGHFHCMTELSADQVFKEIQNVMSKD